MDRNQAWALLSDPETSAETLAQVAAEHREFWPQVAEHPNAYPGLIEWMQQQGFVAQSQAQPAQSTSEPSFTPVQQVQPWAQQTPVTVAAPKKRRTGLFVGLAAGLAVVVAAAIAIPMMLGGAGGGSLRDVLKRFEQRDQFGLTIVDVARIESIVGEPFPVNGSEDEIADWAAKAYEMGVGVLSFSSGAGSEGVRFLAAGRGWAQWSSPDDSMLITTLAPVSSSKLDELFGAAEDGVWRANGVSVTKLDGNTYAFPDHAPEARPNESSSLAADDSATRVLVRLEKLDAFWYLIGRDDQSSRNLVNASDGSSDRIETSGMAVAMRDSEQRAVLVWDFGTAERAERNASFVREAVERIAQREGVATPEIQVEGSLVIAETSSDDERPFDIFREFFELRVG